MRKENTVETKKAQELVSKTMATITEETKNILIDYIQNGYIESLSKAIAYLGMSPDEANILLGDMSETVKERITSNIAHFQKHDESVVSEVEHIVLTRGKKHVAEEYKVIKENLPFAGKEFAEKSIQNFRAKTPIFQKTLDECIFTFEDINQLDDREIQKILYWTGHKTLTLALKGASKELRKRIFRNKPKKEVAMLKEAIEFLGSVRDSWIEEAQAKIVKNALRLEADGEIVIWR
ncbi:MAG: hypothetical protein J5647_03145 [Spirochaetaceae bacterium]|nr:hypothetical protein [Spirochaetaceae bacterium]